MFLKIVKGKKKKYLYLVEGYREDGKVKHRTICSLGALDNIAPNLLAVAEQLGLVDGKILLKPELAQIMQKVNWGAITIRCLWVLIFFQATHTKAIPSCSACKNFKNFITLNVLF